MKKKKEEKTKLVRIEIAATDAVEKHVEVTKQSVGGFFAIAALEKLSQLTPDKIKTNGKN